MVYIRKHLMNTLFVFLFLPLAHGTAATVYEGFGEIKSRDTRKARSQAVKNVMRGAMDATLRKNIKASIQSKYKDMLDRHVVQQYDLYVKDYRIVREVAEGTSYRVQAQVNLDQDKLLDDLKAHGLVKSDLATPKVLAFIKDVSKTGEHAWWVKQKQKPGTPVGGYTQDRLLQRLRGLPLQLYARPSLKKAMQQPPLAEIFQSEASGMLSEEVLLQVAKKIKSAYLIHGKLHDDFSTGSIHVVDVMDNTRVANLVFTDRTWKNFRVKTPEERLDSIVYHIIGAIHGSWVKRWQQDEHIVLKVVELTKLNAYRKLFAKLKKVRQITHMKEHAFSYKTVELHLVASINAKQLARVLQKKNKKFRFQHQGSKVIEAKLK